MPCLGRLAILLSLPVLFGCGEPEKRASLRAYLFDPNVRRQALSDALWFHDNDYARLRSARFATADERSWERLPLWLPQAAPVRDGSVGEEPRPLAVELPGGPDGGPDAALRQALLRLGEAAFFDYPVQLVGGFDLALRSEALSDAYGLWRGRAPHDPPDAAPRIGGVLRVQLPRGAGTALGLSCAACHAARQGDRIEPGAPNGRLDIGALSQDQARPGAILPEARWGPGRLDVSPDGMDNPAAIPDLRALRFQHHLQHAATLRTGIGAEPLALAVRTETLMVTTLLEQARPPTALALALALYLSSLAAGPPEIDDGAPGRGIFRARCERCHAPPDYAGEPVPLSEVGTDPSVGLSRERGTGTYRTPSLRGVSHRGPLLHDGRVPNLAALLDPARLLPGYDGALHGAGPVPGHTYGLDLPAADRAALLSFLHSI